MHTTDELMALADALVWNALLHAGKPGISASQVAARESLRTALEAVAEDARRQDVSQENRMTTDNSTAPAETFEEKCARNARVQGRYDELMAEGKRGHYETMFRVVREEVERVRAALAAAPHTAAPVVQPVVPAGWKPIETAPRGSGEDGPSDTRHPDYVAPPKLLLWTQEGPVVGYYDWYYHPGYGRGAEHGESVWRDHDGGRTYGASHWMPLPAAPASDADSMPAQPTKDAACR